MKIKDTLAKWVLGKYANTNRLDGVAQFPDFYESRKEFADAIFLNITDLLTDIISDVTLVLKKGDAMLFAEFKIMFENYGQVILNEMFTTGYAVIGYKETTGFFYMDKTQYTLNAKNEITALGKLKNAEIYVLKSDTYILSGRSDKAMLHGFLSYLDNVLNASNTTTARLGSLIMASPKQLTNSPIASVITNTEKKDAEKEISDEYGSLKKQKQILIWRQAMDFTTINLAGLDAKTIDKARFAVAAICDRFKVPAPQVALIDSTVGGASLSNGGEIREGDLLKYKSFERLLNKTFIKMAKDIDLILDYEIYNKPKQEVTTPSGF